MVLTVSPLAEKLHIPVQLYNIGPKDDVDQLDGPSTNTTSTTNTTNTDDLAETVKKGIQKMKVFKTLEKMIEDNENRVVLVCWEHKVLTHIIRELVHKTTVKHKTAALQSIGLDKEWSGFNGVVIYQDGNWRSGIQIAEKSKL